MSSIFPAAEFATARPRLSLDGTWAFSYDPDDLGIRQGWFADDAVLPEAMTIPGCSQARHYASAQGNVRVTDVEIPEHSQTIMLKYGCMAPSWYRRTFPIPAEWQGSEIHLCVGGVKPAAEFWLNGQPLGTTVTSRSPIRVDLTPHVTYGAENTLTLRLHWARYRLDGVLDIWHAWSGIYRSIWVEAQPAAALADIHITPAIAPPAATVEVALRGATTGKRLRITCDIADQDGEQAFHGETTDLTLTVPMPDARLWSTQAPHLYYAVVRLYDGDTLLDEGRVRFGLREISYRGFTVLLNGTPIFLRGGCDDHVYPQTVCPPADVAFYRERIRKAKAYGFNYTKSACDIFTHEFLEAADELGYLVCQEMPLGSLGELRAIRDTPPPVVTDLWQREVANIVTAYRNHPSVVINSMTSECDINLENPEPYRWFCRALPAIARRCNPHALIFDVTAGFCRTTETRFGPRDTDLLEDVIANSYTITPLNGPLPIPDTVNRPFLLHEWNWTTSLPDPAIIDRYQDSPLMPVQVPEMVEVARANGLVDELHTMAERSRQLRYTLRKDVYEQAHKHPKVAGYHGWLIHDVSYCPEGVFNEFWEEPADLPAAEFRTYNDDTVLTLDDADRRCFTYGSRVPLGMTISHFGDTPLRQPVLRWRVQRAGETVAEGRRTLRPIACGRRVRITSLGLPRMIGEAPAKMELVCELWEGERQVNWNHWPLWVFPELANTRFACEVAAMLPLPAAFRGMRKPYDPLAPPPGAEVFVTHRLRDGSGCPVESLIDFLAQGGRVLLLAGEQFPEAESAFYRTVPYNLGSVGNMGTVIRPHAALGDFPHEGWCDLPFIPLIQGAYPLRLDTFRPQRIDPIIRSIGHQVTMVDKAYLFEVGIGRGVLLACSLHLQPLCHTDPAARYLLACLLRYLADGPWQPEARMTPEQFKTIAQR